MNKNFELEIEVLWHTTETSYKDEHDISYSPSELENRTITFYNIDAVSPYLWDDNSFSFIHSGGEKWISPYSYNEVKELISKAWK